MFVLKKQKTKNEEIFDKTEKAVVKISCQKMSEFLQKKSIKESLDENEQLALSSLNSALKKLDKMK